MKQVDTKEHYKMYKSGKFWSYSIILCGVFTMGMVRSNTVSASEVENYQVEFKRNASDTDRQNRVSPLLTDEFKKTEDSNEQKVTEGANNASQEKWLDKKDDSIGRNNDESNIEKTDAQKSDSNGVTSETDSNNEAEVVNTIGLENDISGNKENENKTDIQKSDTNGETSTTSEEDKAEDAKVVGSENEEQQDKVNENKTEQVDDKKTTKKQKKQASRKNNKSDVKKDNNKTKNNQRLVAKDKYNEEYRNQFHYSPEKNWVNDPNGLFYDDSTGLYHMYYQYNPKGNEWGNLSWGHATSKDLIHWTEQDVAIPMLENQDWEDFVYTNTTGDLAKYGEVRYVGNPTPNWGATEGGKMIFSGSVVVDKNNVSGLGKNAILAFYTASYQIATRINDHQDNGWGTWIGLNDIQEQHLAYSLDGGYTFKQYSSDGNSAKPLPIIPVTESHGGDAANFRDPNVVYDKEHQQYVMTVVSGQMAQIYISKDLLHWNYASNIERQNDVGNGVWECPTLIPMQVEGSKEVKWILSMSVNKGAHATGSGMQYFIGDLDANGKWTPESSETLANPMTTDFGEDFYAGIPFANMKDGRTVMLAWESNWDYSEEQRNSTWWGNFTLPRELKLVKDSNTVDGYLLKNEVVSEVQNIEKDNIIPDNQKNFELNANQDKKITYDGHQYKIKATFSWDKDNAPTTVAFKIRTSEDVNHYLLVGYDLNTSLLFVNRLNTGEANMGSPRDHMNAYVDTSDGTITITVYVDETSVEVFANDGEKSITQDFYMLPKYVGDQNTDGIYVYSQDGNATVEDFTLNPLASIWHESGTIDPGEPSDPEEPTNPGEPTDPEEPTNPEEPENSGESTNPEEPTNSEESENPEESTNSGGLINLEKPTNMKESDESKEQGNKSTTAKQRTKADQKDGGMSKVKVEKSGVGQVELPNTGSRKDSQSLWSLFLTAASMMILGLMGINTKKKYKNQYKNQ